jgi:Putative transposase/Transposase zinc-binding domain
MFRSKLEVADIFRRHGEAWRTANVGHVSLTQRRVMTAIESCRTAALGGHVEQCEDCAHTRIAYNSCRNRHCAKCQWRSAQAWLAAREAELLPVPYVHLVFRLPAGLGPIALQNKALVYGLLLKAAAETLITIAADRNHLGAKIGVLAVLHTWGSQLQHHPHAHCIVPAGGISPDGKSWVAGKPGFLRPSRLLSDLFRRLFLEGLTAAFDAGKLQFCTELVGLNEPEAFAAALARVSTTAWTVYAKKPFGGPKKTFAYLARYTHRVAITNSRLIELVDTHVSFRRSDYRESDGHGSRGVRLKIAEFIRRFLLHILPDGFQRIRYYGFLANSRRAEKLAVCRSLLDAPSASTDRNIDDGKDPGAPDQQPPPCPCCGGRMKIIETFDGSLSRPYHVRRLDAL